ncbi:MAG: hypothetical protein K2L55_04340 [Muribaculaceae bacterium]|nr:hypothetical protein [Muribaculaceae bacterium]
MKAALVSFTPQHHFFSQAAIDKIFADGCFISSRRHYGVRALCHIPASAAACSIHEKTRHTRQLNNSPTGVQNSHNRFLLTI